VTRRNEKCGWVVSAEVAPLALSHVVGTAVQQRLMGMSEDSSDIKAVSCSRRGNCCSVSITATEGDDTLMWSGAVRAQHFFGGWLVSGWASEKHSHCFLWDAARPSQVVKSGALKESSQHARARHGRKYDARHRAAASAD
jgi:hypothetical protein